MPEGYHQLTYEQRCQIVALKKRGDNASKIAKVLGVNRSSISRELRRNSGQRGYRYEQAHSKAVERKFSNPSKMTPQMTILIEEKLRLQWSPVQISGWLKKQHLDSVSHETIYKHVWRDKKEGGSLYKELRHHGKKYNKRGKGTSGRGCIPNRVDIDKRPPIVEEKIRLGDLELDTIIGADHSGAIVSIVDRASKLINLVKVERKTAEEVGKALIGKLKPIEQFVLTMTADNGKEFSYHEMVAVQLGAEFYFAKPYHSWERGLNEHTNGLVRQYFPKNFSFADITIEGLEKVENLLNNRPRKVLDFETPLERFEKLAKNMQKKRGYI
jgi:IS30 family transposase